MLELKTPTHTSHSAKETLERCAKSYYLGRIAGAPKRPAIWSAGGSAVHETTEAYDLHAMTGHPEAFTERLEAVWDAIFDEQIAKVRAAEPNESTWRRSQNEDATVWRSIGLGFVREYIDWRERANWEIWEAPDGQAAIELDVSGRLPGCSVEIKAYLDRVFYDPTFNKHWILDLKTGRKPPATPAQFETYAALLQVKYGLKADGVAFMNRRGALGKPWDLSQVTPKTVGAVYGEAWKRVQSGDFPADGFPSSCFICDVQSACVKQNGPLAHFYDPDHPDYQPPF